MNKNYKQYLAGLMCAGMSMTAHATNEPGTAYYSDFDNNRVIKIDIASMSLVDAVATGSQPYPVDLGGVNGDVLVMTRGEGSVDVVDSCSFANTGPIDLVHQPRSSAYNADNRRLLISGKDTPQTTLLKSKQSEYQIQHVVGSDVFTAPVDFGGSLATGHPYWVDNSRFMQLDRTTRVIQLYKRNGNLLDSLTTPTSTHHILRAGSDYYAVLEGSPSNGIFPGLMRFTISGDALQQTGIVYLDDSTTPAAEMGGHHADLHPDGEVIYMGSTDGRMFVVDRDDMQIVSVIETGLGTGHTKFASERNLAIVTNHNDTFVTIIDTLNHVKVTDVEVAVNLPSAGHKSQAHTASVSPDQRYYYGMASDEGVFYQLDLETMIITDQLNLGQGYFIQGSFKWGQNNCE